MTNDSDFSHIASRLISYQHSVYLFTTKELVKGHTYSRRVQIEQITVPPSTKKTTRPPKPSQELSAKSSTVADQLPASATVKPKSPVAVVKSVSKSKAPAPPNPLQVYGALDRSKLKAAVAESEQLIIGADRLFGAFREIYGVPWNSGNRTLTPQALIDDFLGQDSFIFAQGAVRNQGFFLDSVIDPHSLYQDSPRVLTACFGASVQRLESVADIVAKFFAEADFEQLDVEAQHTLTTRFPGLLNQLTRNVLSAYMSLLVEEYGTAPSREILQLYDKQELLDLFYHRFGDVIRDKEKFLIEVKEPINPKQEASLQRIKDFMEWVAFTPAV